MDVRGAAGGLVNAGQQAQQGGFTGTIMANQPHPVTLAEMQIHIAQGLNYHGVVLIAADGAASRPEEGLFHGAGFRIENGEVHARVISINRNHESCLLQSYTQ